MTASSLLVLLAMLCVSFLILDFTFWRDDKAVFDPHDCKHQCEWQLAKMNETFNTLIAVCEEKLQKLHGSDMNLAIIREQLHKEILELFWYEFQTFQRLHSSRIESAPQFCLEYCTVMDSTKHRECKENVTNNHYQIQMLLQRERWLRGHIHRRLLLIRGNGNSVESETLSMLWPSIIAIVIALVGLYVMVVEPTRDKIATLTERKERIEAQFRTTQTQLLQVQEETRSRIATLTEQKERIEVQFHTTQTQLLQVQEETRSRIATLTEQKERIEAQFRTTQTQLLQVQEETRNRIATLTEQKERIEAQFRTTQTQLLQVQEETRNRIATLTEQKERIEAQFRTTQTQLLQVQEETRNRIATLTEQKERIEAQFCTTQTQLLQVQEEVSEKNSDLESRNSILESWNEKLLGCEMMLKSRLVDLCSEKDLLYEEYKETLALKDKSLKNMDEFWHQWLVKEREARKTAEEKETASVEESKQLAREITRYQSTINGLEAKLKQAQERDAEGEQIMVQRQEEVERRVRELERETNFLQLELEGSKMDLSVETERKNRALAHVSGLEKEVEALKLQAARLVEGALKKGSKMSKLGSSASHHQTKSAQESNSLRVIDSRLEDIRQDFESRFTQLQNKFDDQVTRDSEELHMLRLEHQKLCESLELANRRNLQLEKRLACQEPIQSSYRRRISPRQRLPRQRSSSIKRNDSFLTQPEYEPVSVQDLTDYLSIY